MIKAQTACSVLTFIFLLAFQGPAAWASDDDEKVTTIGACEASFAPTGAQAVSSFVPLEVDYAKAPSAYRSKELWALQSHLSAVNHRLSAYEERLRSDGKKAGRKAPEPFYWLFEDKFESSSSTDSSPVVVVKLSEEEKAALKRAIEELKKFAKKIQGKIDKQMGRDRDVLLAEIKNRSTDPRVEVLLKERLRLSRLFDFPKDRTVTVLSGNSVDTPSPEQVALIENLVRGLLERGNLVLHDGDSPMAPYIKAIAGKKAFSVSEKDIPNVYLRLHVLEHPNRAVITPDSLMGMALRLQNKNGLFVLENGYDKSWELSAWAYGLDKDEINQGVKSYPKPTFKDLDSLFALEYAKAKEADRAKLVFPKVDKELYAPSKRSIDFMSYGAAEKFLEFSDELLESEKKLNGVGGAVVFGSGGLGPYTDLIYDTTRALAQLGVPIVTGGAGGAMQIANTAAFDAGSTSIGIPIGGKNMLASERIFPTEVQTDTVMASGYPTRIPLLLNGRSLVVIVPGGNGTMQELATTFIQYASQPHAPVATVFVGHEYYGGLWDHIQGLPIPAAVKEKFFIVDSAAEMEQLALHLSTNVVYANRLIQLPQPTPRNARTSFPKPEPKKSLLSRLLNKDAGDDEL